jgi:hypothetical protein
MAKISRKGNDYIIRTLLSVADLRATAGFDAWCYMNRIEINHTEPSESIIVADAGATDAQIAHLFRVICEIEMDRKGEVDQ